MKSYSKFSAPIILLLGLALPTVHADTLKLFDSETSPADLADFLFSANKIKTRSLKAQPDQNVAAMKIEFAFDSSTLTTEATLTIDVMAQALMHPTAINGRVLIEGHTDSTGPDDYNLHLSERRAEAVKHYLMTSHRISADRLFIQGKGESELLNTLTPSDGLNRRVEFMEIL